MKKKIRWSARETLPIVFRSRHTSEIRIIGEREAGRFGPSVAQVWKGSRTDNRPIQNLVGLRVPNPEGHFMADMFRNPHPIAKGFRGVSGEGGRVCLVVDRLKPRKGKKWTDIRNLPCSDKNRLTMVKGRVRYAVKYISNIAQTQKS